MDTTNILQINHFLFFAGTGVFGLIIGSFLNVVIYRLPIMLKRSWEADCLEYLKQKSPLKYKVFNLFTPRSQCPHCETQISWWQNIPLVSYILLCGKCGHCQNIIHWRYPVVELISCLAALAVASFFGVSVKTIPLLLLTWTLIAAIFIDFDHQILPDSLTLPLIWLGLIINIYNVFTTPQNAIIGAACGYSFLWIITYLFKLVRKIEGMGHGDFKLFAVFGAWLGWQMLPLIILTASLIGSIVGITLVFTKKQQFTNPIPFGPYLAAAGWLAFFFGSDALSWYLRVWL